MRNRTKELIANTLEEMLNSSTLEEVRITTLCQRSGISPQTFYNHFKDKYDVIAWCFRQIYLYAMSTTESLSRQSFLAFLQIILSHQNFYKKAFEDKSENSISNYIYQFSIKILENAVGNDQKVNKMQANEMIEIKYYIYGIAALLEELVVNPSHFDIEQLAEFEYQATPICLRKVLRNYLIDNQPNDFFVNN